MRFTARRVLIRVTLVGMAGVLFTLVFVSEKVETPLLLAARPVHGHRLLAGADPPVVRARALSEQGEVGQSATDVLLHILWRLRERERARAKRALFSHD